MLSRLSEMNCAREFYRTSKLAKSHMFCWKLLKKYILNCYLQYSSEWIIWNIIINTDNIGPPQFRKTTPV